ncbi:MAG: hypothetical protein AAGF24_11605 [Cyanobacteria bacterium P01_H01_bin.121]
MGFVALPSHSTLQGTLKPANVQVLMAQVQDSPTSATPNSDPLIDHTGEDAIYLALLILLVLSALIIGAVSRHLQGAILFSLFVSAVLIVVMIAV